MAKIRVRARAVDMLGRQQIAGIPTAIHELFKNAHDAYAEHVDVDFYRADELLVIRDDGYGMTKDDFEGRWLTLGTESKIGPDKPDAAVWFRDRPKPRPRPMMGEKGIGRLAIAAIGPQVLVLSRATRRDGLSPIVASLIHWSLFETPGIDLDRIELPVIEVPNGDLPDRSLVMKLAGRLRATVEGLGDELGASRRTQILSDLRLADFNPSAVVDRMGGPSLRADGYGTHFFIRPASPMLSADIDGGARGDASELEKMLLGFSNTMMPGRESPSIIAEFRDHREDATVTELIGGDSFFTPEEFRSADHHVEGRFDEFGQFDGSVSVYRRDPKEHSIHWPEARGRKSDCGPFRVKFAYVQGKWKDSRIPQEDWALIAAKLDRIGGLYVYRDGIRILPYGNSDYDFLNIERRRTKSAQDWFFSYRRIFGAIEITQAENDELVEKAGREGFRSNRAYREFRSILENFFMRLAMDFFRPSGKHADEHVEYKQQLNRENELLEKRARSINARRREFRAQLNKYFETVETGWPAAESSRLKHSVRVRLDAIAQIADPDSGARSLLQLENDVRDEVLGIERSLTVTYPRGVGLSKKLREDWQSYLKSFEKNRSEVLDPLKQDVDNMITALADDEAIGLDRRRRLAAAVQIQSSSASSEALRLRRSVEQAFTDLRMSVNETVRFCSTRVQDDVENTLVDLEHTDLDRMNDDRLRSIQQSWTDRLDKTVQNATNVLEALRDQLTSLTGAVRERETLDATTAAIESAAEAYEEQLELYVELAQVGMALGMVQHEFGSTVKKIRTAIRKLKPWADGTPELNDLYLDLRNGFEHLDSFLKLFTPLSRRLYRTPVDLTGAKILRYLTEVFGDRLDRHEIRIIATPEFKSMMVHGYPSTFLPVFVNVVDNAIYWIANDSESQRMIKLDSDGVGFTISNGGPGIERRIADRIFEFGETTKPGGRGMGLFISREALRREGFDLTLAVAGSGEHPAFSIAPRDSDQNGDDSK